MSAFMLRTNRHRPATPSRSSVRRTLNFPCVLASSCCLFVSFISAHPATTSSAARQNRQRGRRRARFPIIVRVYRSSRLTIDSRDEAGCAEYRLGDAVPGEDGGHVVLPASFQGQVHQG